MNLREPIAKDAAYWVDFHLRNWVTWMHGGARPDGLPKQASGGFENYTSFDSEGWTAWENLDKWTAEATNAAVESLVPAEQAAIHRCYLSAVYRFPRENYAQLLEMARISMQRELRKRNVWLGE